MHIEAIRQLCISQPGSSEDFPFDDRTLAFRVGGKIFLLIDVEEPWEFNVKCDPAYAIELREKYADAIRPGYHMNKKHWNTLNTEMGLDEKLIAELILHSYQLVRDSLPKKIRETLQ